MAEFFAMSDFDRFNKENDARLAAFGKRIGEFESIREEIKSLRAIFDRRDSIISDIKLSLDDAGKAIKAHAASLQTHQDLVSKQQEMHNITHDNIRKAIELIKVALSEAGAAHRSSLDKIADLSQKTANLALIKQDLDIHKDDVRVFKNSAISQLDNTNAFVQKLLSEISALKSDLVKVLEFRSRCDADKQEMIAAIKKTADMFSAKQKDVSDAADSKIEAMQKELNDRISSVKVPSNKCPVSEDRVAKIEAQLENIALDAKNAFLKSSNVDMQTQLHNKKIENINLLLKQHELTK